MDQHMTIQSIPQASELTLPTWSPQIGHASALAGIAFLQSITAITDATVFGTYTPLIQFLAKLGLDELNNLVASNTI